LKQRRSLGIQGQRAGQAKPKPGLVFDEAFVDHRQPAQNPLESHRLAHTTPLAAEPPFHLVHWAVPSP
jgi:hypothetical protein